MQGAMSRIETLSAELVQEEQDHLAAAVGDQKKRGKSTIAMLGSLVGGGMVVSVSQHGCRPTHGRPVGNS